MPDVIVLGDSYSMSLGLIRALGEHGYGVRLLKKASSVRTLKTPEECSKYLVKSVRVTNKERALLKGLMYLRDDKEKLLVIPGDDASALFLDDNYKRIQKYFSIPSFRGQKGLLRNYMDKIKQKEIAVSCGILVAEGQKYNTDSNGIAIAISKVKLPCFVKPLISAGSSKELIKCCNSKDELRTAMVNAAKCGCDRVLIERFLNVKQEFVCNGVALGENVFIPACISVESRGVGRRKGVTAEGTVYSSLILGELKDKLEMFVKKIGLVGLFDIELMVCEEGIYFCEMNLRNGATGYAITMAGANLPGILADYIYKGIVPREISIKKNISFLSEKVKMDGYSDGYFSWKQFKMYLNSDKKKFINNALDQLPYKVFQYMVLRRRIGMLKKRLQNK